MAPAAAQTLGFPQPWVAVTTILGVISSCNNFIFGRAPGGVKRESCRSRPQYSVA
jgi:hypothetical protein